MGADPKLDRSRSTVVQGVASHSFIDKTYETPEALRYFDLETKARRTIAELIKPIVEETERDRGKVAKMTVKHDNVMKRLTKIEYIMELNS